VDGLRYLSCFDDGCFLLLLNVFWDVEVWIDILGVEGYCEGLLEDVGKVSRGLHTVVNSEPFPHPDGQGIRRGIKGMVFGVKMFFEVNMLGQH